MTKLLRSSVIPSAVIAAGALILLFARLGHYALWDDEAITAMTSRAVFHTFDTSVKVDDHNLLVYRNGLLVRDFKDRYTPPLQFYVIAPFIGLLGDSNFVCRLPMALCGVITVVILLLWLRRLQPPLLVWWGAAAILLTNASFFLFFRQCRYYGLATMLTAAIAYLYCNRQNRLVEMGQSTTIKDQSFSSLLWNAGLAVALSALLAAQYLDYAAVIGCLIVDYLLWGRRNPFSLRDWLIILIPQLIVGGVVLSIWNPLIAQHQDPYHSANWLLDRLCLWYWNWRDMIACDFVILPLLLVCPVLFLKKHSNWMLRAPMALLVFITGIALAVPTRLAEANSAEVRYLAPALPLCIGVGIVAVWGLQFLRPAPMWMMLLVSAASMFIEPPIGDEKVPSIGSTALMYYHELAVPQIESYTPVMDWINSDKIPRNSTFYIQPGYKAYPLMFRANKVTYVWQLDDDALTFDITTPAEGEMPTLKAVDASGRTITVQVINPEKPDPISVAGALIKAWNTDPEAARIAIATGFEKVILTSIHRGSTLHVAASVQNAVAGKITQTTAVPPREDFRVLGDLHFKGIVAPDYMIRFGTNSESGDLPAALDSLSTRGFHYELIDTIHLHWKDYYRPERIWRSFTTVQPKEGDEIYIYQRKP